ncbi:hypothetical protein ACOMHN_002118 [Nucella lapillus]
MKKSTSSQPPKRHQNSGTMPLPADLLAS